MCGIAGYVAPEQPESAALEAVAAMVRRLERRGPDSEGIEQWLGAVLGHRRLAILDLSEAGRQPMLSDDRQTGVVFNGCIFNFLDLRAELESRGCVFRSHCDTEVLVHGYREWGIDELARRSRGMFAFAVWDNRRRKLLLVRDRLGVKPLVYGARGSTIAFASTLAALRGAGFDGEMDPEAVLEFLEFGYITDERAVWRGVRKLPPATILEWHNGSFSERCYWTLPEADESSPIRFEEAVEETERLLVESVRLRLCSDVPIGALLSGGIDSALVCWAMARLNANIRAFTVGTPGDASDETAGARDTARKLGIPHQVVELPANRPEQLEEMTAAYSEPFACQSAQAMLLVSRAVRPLATVLLTGDGGDDVFLGYPFFYNVWLAQRTARMLPRPVAKACSHMSRWVPDSGPPRRLRNFMGYASEGLRAYTLAHDGLPYYYRRAMLGERLDRLTLRQRNLPGSADAARRVLFDVLAYHRKVHFTSEFMPKVDGGTMHHSLEARSPLLDQKVWEFAASLPPAIRFHGGQLKAVLREIARRRIGPEVAARKKQGFTVPVERWLAERWSAALDELRGDTLLERDGWVRRGAMNAPIADALARQWVPAQLWYLLVLERWLRKQAASPPIASDPEPVTTARRS